MSRPVPQPVLVMSCRTGKFLVGSGSDPHPGIPPGPPFAETMGRLSGWRYTSEPHVTEASRMAEYPLPPPNAA
jgi:hypothetical protein